MKRNEWGHTLAELGHKALKKRIRRSDGKEYDSAKEAAAELECSPQTVRNACNPNQKTTVTIKEYKFEYITKGEESND